MSYQLKQVTHLKIKYVFTFKLRIANCLHYCMNIKISISIQYVHTVHTHFQLFFALVQLLLLLFMTVFVYNLCLIVSCLCHVQQNKCTLIIYVRTKYTRMLTVSVVFIYFYIIVAVFCTLVFIFQATVDFCTKTDLSNKLHLILPTNTSYPHLSFIECFCE